MATLAHVLQLVGGWIAPLIIFLVKRNSRFVSFHALQVLLLQGLYFLLSMIFVGSVFAVMVSTIAFHQRTAQHAFPPAFGLLFLIVWLGMMGWWVFVLVVAIVYGVKAGRGEWTEYPVLGRLARRILRIGPEGGLVP
jgi:uncharacterized membrane protein